MLDLAGFMLAICRATEANKPNGIVFDINNESHKLDMEVLYGFYREGWTIERMLDIYYFGDPFETFFRF